MMVLPKVIPGVTTSKINGDSNSAVSAPSFSIGAPISSLIVESTEDMIVQRIVYRILNFGIASTGKTHFGLSMDEPVIVLYTEDRFKIILGKFKACKDCNKTWAGPSMSCPDCKSKNIRPKDIRGININNMQNLYDGVDIGLKILTDEREKSGKVGTLMVDSYTEAWIHARTEHVQKKYGGDTSIKLSPRDDYGEINPRHNDLRDKLMKCGFNIYLTATQENLFGEDQYDPIGVKPGGQKGNPYAIDWYMFSFFADGVLKVRLEKNSVSMRKVVEYTNFDFDKLQRVESMFRDEEQMITAEVIEKLNKEYGTPTEDVPEATSEDKKDE